jgi:hypothetical protein
MKPAVRPGGRLIDQELRTLAAACAMVANPSSGATAATILLRIGPDERLLARMPLAQLEQRYGVRITVLDEGSPTTQPCVRITRRAAVPSGDEAGRGQGDEWPWAPVRRWLPWRGSREALGRTDPSGEWAGQSDRPARDELPGRCSAPPERFRTAGRSDRGGCAATAARTNDDDDARR